MAPYPDDLKAALETVLRGFRDQDLAGSVRRLISEYRTPDGVAKPVLRSPVDVAAYAAYRMPATFAAIAAAMRAMKDAAPNPSPRSLIDVGGGTGAASWAAAQAWPSLRDIKVIEREREVIAVGKELMADAANPFLRAASWQRADATAAPPEAADLVTISFLLGELRMSLRESFIARWTESAGAVVIVEPGTPAGYARVVTARDQLIAAGLTIIAPCPHQSDCPMVRGKDWCHFAARVNRTALHRRLKGGSLGHEDEKFSYLVALRGGASLTAAARVLRHPQKRKGLVALRLCQENGETADIIVSQRDKLDYAAARDTNWGDIWPPGESQP